MRLSKHHGLGNDFLVLLDLDGTAPAVDEAVARALCDRRRGVGADGLLRVTGDADGADVAMQLWNADGSHAELSGNGLRCVGQAVARHRGVDAVMLTVATGAGLRRVDVRPGPDARTAHVSVDMGPVGDGPEVTVQWSAEVLKAATLDLGNPHLVLLVDAPASVDLAAEGPRYERHFPSGVNVEFVALAPGEEDSLVMTVWERGAGATDACGTGACAAAAAANRWGLVGPLVTVHMPGGDVLVELGDTVTLVGPAVHVADIEVPPWP